MRLTRIQGRSRSVTLSGPFAVAADAAPLWPSPMAAPRSPGAAPRPTPATAVPRSRSSCSCQRGRDQRVRVRDHGHHHRAVPLPAPGKVPSGAFTSLTLDQGRGLPAQRQDRRVPGGHLHPVVHRQRRPDHPHRPVCDLLTGPAGGPGNRPCRPSRADLPARLRTRASGQPAIPLRGSELRFSVLTCVSCPQRGRSGGVVLVGPGKRGSPAEVLGCQAAGRIPDRDER